MLDRPARAAARLAGAACLAAAAGCTPPWWAFSTVDVEGRILADGRCEVSVRGDLTRRLALEAEAHTIAQRDGPPPQPGTGFVVSCWKHSLEARSDDPSRVEMVIPIDDPAGAASAGTYRVLAYMLYQPDRPAPRGVASVSATVYPDPARRRGEWRDYGGVDGTLTLTSVTPDPGARSRGSYRVTGTFRVHARRYFRFD